jgi:hypothetical protein
MAAGGVSHSLAATGLSQALRVSRAGAGSGVVGGSGVLCPQTCSHRYPSGAFAILRAVPALGNRFAGFTGACAGIAPCKVRMSTARRVVATFGPPKGTTITAAKINKEKHSAQFRFAAPGAVTGFECKLIRPKQQHHKASFSTCSAPRRYKHLQPGKYKFKVRARDRVGADATPAKRSFTI